MDRQKCSVHDIRRCILRFLDERVLSKSEDERTQLDQLLLETGRAFTDALVRCEHARVAGETGAERSVTGLLKSYNAINHERARRDLDAETLAIFQEPIKGD